MQAPWKLPKTTQGVWSKAKKQNQVYPVPAPCFSHKITCYISWRCTRLGAEGSLQMQPHLRYTLWRGSIYRLYRESLMVGPGRCSGMSNSTPQVTRSSVGRIQFLHVTHLLQRHVRDRRSDPLCSSDEQPGHALSTILKQLFGKDWNENLLRSAQVCNQEIKTKIATGLFSIWSKIKKERIRT